MGAQSSTTVAIEPISASGPTLTLERREIQIVAEVSTNSRMAPPMTTGTRHASGTTKNASRIEMRSSTRPS
ncbi:MAG TPA: hypothetical protein VI277_09785 [Candidatus Limnocylindria bacterium]